LKGIWFTEMESGKLATSYKVKKILHQETSKYQTIEMFDTEMFGRMLVNDGAVMTTVKDEFVYHEMITLPALNTHPNPKNVLVIGGGDGGTIREIVKHPRVEKATLVEIDERVIEVCKQYLPETSLELDNPKVTVLVDEGIKHVQEKKDFYDVIIVDSTDPVGPAVGLFSKEFYQNVFDALKEDGIFAAQTESPWVYQDFINKIFKEIKSIFPITKLYTAAIPTSPTGLWSFTMGSKKYDPEKVDRTQIVDTNTRYYTADLHYSCFKLPRFIQDILE